MADSRRIAERSKEPGENPGGLEKPERADVHPGERGRDSDDSLALDDSEGKRWRMGESEDEQPANGEINTSSDASQANTGSVGNSTREKPEKPEKRERRNNSKPSRGMGHPDSSEEERLGPDGLPVESEQETERSGDGCAWSGFTFVQCADGKARPVKPGILPLADGVPGRVGQIRAYGNAIVPQVAAEFIKAYMEL